MPYEPDRSRDKSIADLAREAFWFLTHTALALVLLAFAIAAISFNRPDPEAASPKILCTFLAFLVPLFGGLIVARIQQNRTARYVWVSGIILFAIACVWVLDLPTGNGLCETCGAMEKLQRTFFTVDHGSGLMGGDGLLIGAWMPLAMISYAIGARFGLDT